jgi:hypothetical protein
MNHARPYRIGCLRNQSWSDAVDLLGPGLIAFGFVNGSIRRTIDDDIWPNAIDERSNGATLLEIER